MAKAKTKTTKAKTTVKAETTKATKAKKTVKDDSRLIAQVTLPTGDKIQKLFSATNFPVSCVMVQMFAPKTPFHKTWHILGFSSKVNKGRADENRVKRLYIDKKDPAFVQQRYMSVVRTEDITKVNKLDSSLLEDRSAFKEAKRARGELIVKPVAKTKKTA